MRDIYDQLPKCELHLHLEGSVEPETMLELNPSLTQEEIANVYQYGDFAGFIRSYIWVSRQLNTPDDYALVTRRLLERLFAQNVQYAEISLSAGVILWKGQDLPRIYEAVRKEASASPVEVYWIVDAVRQFGLAPAMRVFEWAAERVDDGVVAAGIGGDEIRGPAEWFTPAFELARRAGLKAVPHAGETAGPESVWAALQLGADRIGHGIRAVEDESLMRHLADHDIPLEICVSSNICTGSVRSLADHPLRRLYDAGVPLTLNTDDPAMFHTSLSNEYKIAAEDFEFTMEELRQLAANSFRYAFRAGC